MKIGKTQEKLLFVEKDLQEGQKFAGEFSGTKRRIDKNGKEREYVVIVGGIGNAPCEYLVFPNVLVGVGGIEIDPTNEKRTFSFQRKGRDLLFSV